MIRIASFNYEYILHLKVPQKNYNFLLRALVDESNSIVNLGKTFQILRTYPKIEYLQFYY